MAKFKPNPNLQKELGALAQRQMQHIVDAANSDASDAAAASNLRRNWKREGGDMSPAEARDLIRRARSE